MNATPFINPKRIVIAALVVVVVLAVVIVWSPVPRPQAPALLVTRVRPAYSGQKTYGLASLSLSNGNEGTVLFQPGITKKGIVWIGMWFGVEKKAGNEWRLESDTPISPTGMTVSNLMTAASFNLWAPDRLSDFQVPVPADGVQRRFVVRWKPAPKHLSAPFAWVRQTWNRFMPFGSSSFVELRSAEVAVEKLSDYDYEAAFKRLEADDYKPGQLSITRLEGFGVGYSDGLEASQLLPHEKESP